MKILRFILFLFVPFYFMATWFRNLLFNLDLKKSVAYGLPVICVGNLSIGGTGKTPMIEYLIRLLKADYKVATLSRGYKRKTSGFQLANSVSKAESIGDEPFQFYSKFKNDILVAVDGDRRNGIEALQKENPDVILLDDAFQHRQVKAGLNVLLTTYKNPYFDDIVLPTGNLREPRGGSKRANIIVVTKCPENMSESKKAVFLKGVNPERYQHVFFSSIVYSQTVFSAENEALLTNINNFTLVTGIANATPLVEFLKRKNLNFEHLNFQDHYSFTESDILNLQQKQIIITTEKDFMRLKQYDSLRNKLYYIPITITIEYSEKFNRIIKKMIESYR